MPKNMRYDTSYPYHIGYLCSMKRGQKPRTAKYIHPLLLQERYEEVVQFVIENRIDDETIIELVSYFDDEQIHLLLPLAEHILAFEERDLIYKPYFKERLAEVKALLKSQCRPNSKQG